MVCRFEGKPRDMGTTAASLLWVALSLFSAAHLQPFNIHLGQLEDKDWPWAYTPSMIMAIENFLNETGPFAANYNIRLEQN